MIEAELEFYLNFKNMNLHEYLQFIYRVVW